MLETGHMSKDTTTVKPEKISLKAWRNTETPQERTTP